MNADGEGGQKIKSGESFDPRKLDTPLDKLTRKAGGKRSLTRTERKRGRYIQARPANGKTNDLAFDLAHTGLPTLLDHTQLTASATRVNRSHLVSSTTR